MKFDVVTKYAEYKDCHFRRDTYCYGNHVYIGIVNEEDGPIADLTVNVDAIDDYPANCGAVDVNNFPEGTDLIEQLGIGTFVGCVMSGFCVYPVYAFDLDEVDKYL